MQPPFAPRRTIFRLLVAAVLLPITICVVAGVAALLGGMGDDAGAAALRWIALAGGILWVIDLVSLVLLLAISAAGGGPDPPDGP
jgi:hypothetical protein